MSWLYSRALVEASSADTCLDGAACALWNGMPTQRPSWLPARMTDASHLSRSGTTCKPLTDDPGEALLTWCLADSRARTSPQPEKVLGSTAKSPGCGATWRALSVRFDPATASWRTAHSLFPEDSTECSPTLPRWGMMRGGELWERLTSGLPTREKESGLWPTPNAMDAIEGELMQCPEHWERRSKEKAAAGIHLQLPLRVAVRMLPTQRASDGSHGGRVTPRKARNGVNLIEAVSALTFATPTVNDSKNSTLPPSMINRDSLVGDLLRAGVPAGGRLNPSWVEWLMGWPIGWTACEPLATDKFQLWCNSHGRC